MTIEERRPGVWRVRVSAGVDRVTGKRRVINRTILGERRDAELAEARIIVEHADGAHLGTNATVAELFAAWLPQAKLEPTAAYDYRLVAEKHILPRIGHMPLHAVHPFTLDRLYADLERDGVGQHRIKRVHTVLRSAFKRAVKWEWLSSNPAAKADVPAVTAREIMPPTPEQVRALFDAAENAGPRWFTVMILAASLSSRRGELCGLQWSDIDLDQGTVTIRRKVGVVEGHPFIREVLKGEKSRTSARSREPKPITAGTVDVLKRWRVASAEERLAARTGTPDWLFLSPAQGGFMRPDILSRTFRSLVTAAGLPEGTRLHDIRHYVATVLRDAGIDLDVISRRLGHSKTSTTIDTYGHAVSGRAREAAEVLDRITHGR